jgi:hypothetical protein
MKTCIKCGSHAFNLYAEEINQGGLCDVHYWQGRAHRAKALAQPEQKPVATMKMLHTYGDTTPPKRPWVGLNEQDFSAINQSCLTKLQAATSAESILKEKNAP